MSMRVTRVEEEGKLIGNYNILMRRLRGMEGTWGWGF
jgi:hypothetical protein